MATYSLQVVFKGDQGHEDRRPEKVTVDIYRDGEQYAVGYCEPPTWYYDWYIVSSELYKYDWNCVAEGSPFYETTISAETNTWDSSVHNIITLTYSVQNYDTWVQFAGDEKVNLTGQLKIGTKVIDTFELNAQNQYIKSWTDLEKKGYSVSIDPVPGWKIEQTFKDATGTGFKATKLKDYSVNVLFEGEETVPISAQFLKGGTRVESFTLNEANNFSRTWNNLDPANYSISVTNPNGWTVKLIESDETHSTFQAIKLREYHVSISFLTPNDSITGINVTLYQGNNRVSNTLLDASNGWQATFAGLEPGEYHAEIGADTGDWMAIKTETEYSTHWDFSQQPSILKVEVYFVGDQYYLNQRPRSVVINLNRNGEVFRKEVYNHWNDFMLFYAELDKAYTWAISQDEIPYYTTQIEIDGNIVRIYNIWSGRPEPNPQPGQHPTTKDLDLMYSVLYDDFSAENAFDIIHILDYGDHADPPFSFPFK